MILCGFQKTIARTKKKKRRIMSFKEDIRNAERAVLIACAPMLLTTLIMILAAIAY